MVSRITICIGLLLLHTACSSKFQVEDITHVAPGKTISGLPFRVMETYTAHLYAYNEQTKTYEFISTQEKSIASLERVYAVGFDSKFLANHEYQLRINPNGTMQFAKLTTEGKEAETLAALGAQAEGVAGKVAELEAAHKTRKQARTTEANAAIDAEEIPLQQALAAQVEVEKAEAALNSLSPEATALDMASAKGAIKIAKQKANAAFRKAGLAPPHPDIFP